MADQQGTHPKKIKMIPLLRWKPPDEKMKQRISTETI